MWQAQIDSCQAGRTESIQGPRIGKPVKNMQPDPSERLLAAHRDHDRHFQENRYVYPVLSRRSRGISVGINLNPDKICNFDCVYCQVDRNIAPEFREVEPARVLRELEETLAWVQSGRLYDDTRFASVPGSLRRLSDIAFSGDGEPTTYPGFLEIVHDVAALKRRLNLGDVKLVLLTNATMLHRKDVNEALRILDANQGEIWAKLDAGSEADYHAIDRTEIPLARVLANIVAAARQRAIVIQSLFLTLDGQGPGEAQIDAYCRRLSEILVAGGQISRVQVYTVARPTAFADVGAVAGIDLDRIGETIRRHSGLNVEVFHGAASTP
jgi:wyosine [tRNA(Phe)-imidazoG37] synthetase (radical SAM superfamily)